jgi:hypothetical protein
MLVSLVKHVLTTFTSIAIICLQGEERESTQGPGRPHREFNQGRPHREFNQGRPNWEEEGKGNNMIPHRGPVSTNNEARPQWGEDKKKEIFRDQVSGRSYTCSHSKDKCAYFFWNIWLLIWCLGC